MQQTISFLPGFEFETDGQFVSLNAVSDACNLYRLNNGLRFRPLGNLTGPNIFKEFVKKVEEEFGLEKGVYIIGGGNYRKTMAHHAVAAYIIEEYAPGLRIAMLKKALSI